MPWSDEVQFCYRSSEHHHFWLARISSWRGEPYFGGFTDLARGDLDCRRRAPIVRRLATERDVEGLARLWAADKAPGGFRCTLREWAERAIGYPNLSARSMELLSFW